MQLIVNSLLTHYERSGSGKVVLLLHGWGDNLNGLRPAQLELSRQYDVINLDLPGFGQTESPKAAWGLDEYAQFVSAFLAKLDTSPHAILAHSNGGAIAVRGLGKNYLTSDKLVLIASAGIRSEYQGKKKALRLLAKTGKLLTLPLPKQSREKLRRRAYKTIGSDLFVAEHLQASFKRVVTDDVQADAANIHLPTLLLYGDADEQTPLRFGEKLHELMDHSKLSVIPGGDHFMLQKHPDEVMQQVKQFLNT